MAKKVYLLLPKVYAFVARTRTEKVGGAEIQLFQLGSALASKGIEVHFGVANYGQPRLVQHQGMWFHRLFDFADSPLWAFLQIVGFMWQHEPGLLVFRSASLQTALVLLFAKLFTRHRLLYMVASDMEVQPQWFARDRSHWAAWLMQQAYRAADVLTAQNEFQQQVLLNRGLPIQRFPNLLAPCPVSLSAQQRSIWVGKALKMKRTELYLELARRNPQHQFALVLAHSVADDTYWQELKKEAENLPNVLFLGQLERDELLKELALSALYVLTSEYEGFSNSMLEAMQAGCAVLSWTVNPDQVLQRHQLGWCADGDDARFFDLYEHISSQPNEWHTCRQNAQAYIEKHHSLAAIPALFWQTIHQLTR